MQKKIIALAVAGLVSGGAFAQSSVTIYGVVDATFDNVTANGSTGGAATNYKARNRISSNSSYIGFKGWEDLGGGLKAMFQIENGLQIDNGAAGAWNGRDSYVGLAGEFGTLLAGNLTGPTRALGQKLDVNAGATGIGDNSALIGKLGGGAGASVFDQRANNAVAYITPDFSGIKAVLVYSAGITNTFNGVALVGRENAGAGTSAKGNTAWSAGLNYDNGPLYVGYAYTTVGASNSGAGGAADGLVAGVRNLDNNRLGAIYKFGDGQVGLLLDRSMLTPTVGAKISQNVYYLSGKYKVTPAGVVIAQYGRANNATNAGIGNTGANHFEIGYEYSLSKRTIVKALYSGITNKTNANYDYFYGVTNGNSTATTNTLSAGADPSGVSVGIRHSF